MCPCSSRNGTRLRLQLWPAGSYQITIDPGFRRDLLSLIDRGFMFAIAHIRGGGELGRQWCVSCVLAAVLLACCTHRAAPGLWLCC